MICAPLCLVVMIQHGGDDDDVNHDVGLDVDVKDAVATLVMIVNVMLTITGTP